MLNRPISYSDRDRSGLNRATGSEMLGDSQGCKTYCYKETAGSFSFSSICEWLYSRLLNRISRVTTAGWHCRFAEAFTPITLS